MTDIDAITADHGDVKLCTCSRCKDVAVLKDALDAARAAIDGAVSDALLAAADEMPFETWMDGEVRPWLRERAGARQRRLVADPDVTAALVVRAEAAEKEARRLQHVEIGSATVRTDLHAAEARIAAALALKDALEEIALCDLYLDRVGQELIDTFWPMMEAALTGGQKK